MDFFKYWFFWLFHPTAITLRRSSLALGDNLLLSVLMREIKKSYPKRKIIVETTYPELFKDNPNADLVIKKKGSLFYIKPQYYIDSRTNEHLIDQMISSSGLELKNFERKVDFYFPKNLNLSYLHLPEKYIVVNPEGKKGHSANRKEWGWNNFSRLREILSDFDFIQVGNIETPLLPNTIDYRGKSIIECAWIIKNSLTGVFLEGGLMHLANGANKSCVIIYGGVVSPRISGYHTHKNIATKPYCSPCFTSHKKMTFCERMVCMKSISPKVVAKAVLSLIQTNKAQTSA